MLLTLCESLMCIKMDDRSPLYKNEAKISQIQLLPSCAAAKSVL